MRGVAEDFHPMRGLILNAPVDHAMNNSVLHSAISVGVVCPDEHNQKFAQFISGLNRQSQAKHNTDYLISFPGFYQAFKTGLDLPDPTSSKWKQIRIGLNIKELFYKSFSELPKRVVIHKRTPFRREEVKGLVESLSSAGVKNIELLEITYEDNLKCFALNERCTQVDGYPVRRGMCFPIDKNTMYLFTHGIAPSVISPKRRYFQGGKSVPLPLKVVKHYGSGDMAQIATEILGLSKMNWNSFGLYSKLPCTIESSNEIARIGWLLSQFEGTLYDYRYFM